ncbi:hypothetical protein KAU33_09775 [Candidatus Dependentiae bacterium]|nr:hypothetical protein [Candidatus Dependentiae bacterium]
MKTKKYDKAFKRTLDILSILPIILFIISIIYIVVELPLSQASQAKLDYVSNNVAIFFIVIFLVLIINIIIFSISVFFSKIERISEKILFFLLIIIMPLFSIPLIWYLYLKKRL